MENKETAIMVYFGFNRYNTWVKTDTGIIFQVSSVTCECVGGQQRNTPASEYEDIENCQLILRSVDDITEEEREEVEEIACDQIRRAIGKGYGFEGSFDTKDCGWWAVFSSSDGKDYLRKIGIDCDYLIERGLAVRKGTEK